MNNMILIKKRELYFILALLLTTTLSCQSKFDQKVWIENNNNLLVTKNNPRQKMISDLLENHLFVGMKIDTVISVLGKPYKDTEKCYIPNNVKTPDSLKNIIYNFKDNKKREKKYDELNKWYNENCIKGRYLIYPLGWNIIDPVFLEIEIDKKRKVKRFYIHKT